MADLELLSVVPPSRGHNLSAAPEYLPQDQGQLVSNLLTGYPGRLPMRGSLYSSSGLVPFAPNAYGALAPVPGGDQVALQVSGDGTHLYTFSPGAAGGGLGSVAYALANSLSVIVAPTSLGSYTWLIDDSGTLDASSMYLSRFLVRLDSAVATVTYSNAPRSPGAVKAHLSRLLVLGGSVPGTTAPIYGNKLYWTDPGGPTADTLAMWQDDVSGLVNQIDLGGAVSDRGVGLAVVGNGNQLLILRNNQTQILYGTSPSNWSVRNAPFRCGASALASPLEHAGGVFWITNDAQVAYYNGSSFRIVSGPVKEALQAAYLNLGPGGAGGPLSASLVSLDSDHIMVAVVGVDSTNPVSRFCGIYNLPADAWSSFSSTLMTDTPRVLGATQRGVPVALDGSRIWSLQWITAPPTALMNLPAATSLSTGNPLPVGGVDRRWSGTTVADAARVPAELQSRVINLGVPLRAAQLNRAFLDSRWSGALAPYSGWQISLIGGDGTVLLPSATVNGVASPGRTRQRSTHECFKEATDVYVRIAASAGTDVLADATILTVALAFQRAYRR